MAKHQPRRAAREIASSLLGRARPAIERSSEKVKSSLDILRERARRHSHADRFERDVNGAQPASPSIHELKDVGAFERAVATNAPILNVDLATHIVRLHPQPLSCPWITVAFFEEKVVRTGGKTGGYFVVEDEAGAKRRWPTIEVCQVCDHGVA